MTFPSLVCKARHINPGVKLAFAAAGVRRMSENRHFEESDHTRNYALFRPVPPEGLVKKIVEYADKHGSRNLALDVGCGSGQSTLVLSPFFKKVVGVDISKAQIDEANGLKGDCNNVEYRVAGETHFDFPNEHFDLLTACQAIHWFDIPKFYAEVQRVLRPGGVVAVYGYSFTGPSPTSVKNWKKAVAVRDQTYVRTKPYWSKLRVLVDEEYKTIPQLPFADLERDDSHFVEVEASLKDFAGYVTTWSGYQKLKKELGQDQGEQLIADFVQG